MPPAVRTFGRAVSGAPAALVAVAAALLMLVVAVAFGAPAVGDQTLGDEARAASSGSAARAVVDPVVTIAGDIATSGDADSATAALVQRLNPDYALTVGDHVYPYGSQTYYQRYYEPTWGAFKTRTRPSPGNHDYREGSGTPPYYYTYFADQLPATNDGRYYAFNVGGWRLYSLNCEIPCGSSSAQAAWLREDLATAGAGLHKLAYLHRPRYSCGPHGSATKPDALWDALIAARTDLVVAGHDHNYQRFPRMNSNGGYSATGPISIIAGTGGVKLNPVTGEEDTEGCSKAQYVQSSRHGVLRVRLGADDFRWTFVTTGDQVIDSGTRAALTP
jgi:acid phosphatase type 7